MYLIEKAKEISEYIHRNQKYGKEPYSYHINEVIKELSEYKEDKDIIILAYLHDTIEDVEKQDNNYLKEELKNFDDNILKALDFLTDEEGRNRKERKEKTYNKLKSIEKNTFEEKALIVKAADRLANIKECIRTKNKKLLDMYKKEHNMFMEGCYRENIAEDVFDKIKKEINYKINKPKPY